MLLGSANYYVQSIIVDSYLNLVFEQMKNSNRGCIPLFYLIKCVFFFVFQLFQHFNCNEYYVSWLIADENNEIQGWPLASSVRQAKCKRMRIFAFWVNNICLIFLQGESRDQQICQFLICWEIETKQCVSRTEMRAYDGTTCGNRMWCMMGQCVKDNNAPATKTGAWSKSFNADEVVRNGFTIGQMGQLPRALTNLKGN